MTNRLQPIYDIAALCAARQIRQAVLCPGSRNAPLILAFSKHPDIISRSISDERSAAFIALGISQQLGLPAVVVSTSGSAAYNFAPAVAEAYFAHTPLLVITADRPTEWVGQQDGQTIFQQDIFGNHVKRCYQLPQEYEHPDNVWAINRMVNEAINLAQQSPKGPVHINVPLREPLYPGDHGTAYSADIRLMEDVTPSRHVRSEATGRIMAEWAHENRVLVVCGQQDADPSLRDAVSDSTRRLHLPLVADALSNLHGVNDAMRNADLFLGNAPASLLEQLKPELLITFGESVLSKNLKTFLRTYKPRRHWHIQAAGDVADTFKSITSIFRVDPTVFFQFLADMPLPPAYREAQQTHYKNRWAREEEHINSLLATFYPQQELGEAEVVMNALRNLPPACNVHLANSMSVRYATQAGLLPSQELVRVYANRGTSGIDGCSSTAVGHSLASPLPNLLVTGDVAFFYDRNAFWHNYPIPNLRILLLNNHGGGIFRMIDGPGDVKEIDEFLVTRQPLTGKKLCEEFGFEYNVLDSRRKMSNAIADLLEPSGRPKLLELNTAVDTNKNILLSLKRIIKDSYEH
jgi:2-succinyl-5-enolpyruvyl-6-hydroxy-3-cyclohexene-1-carboxylate synthase